MDRKSVSPYFTYALILTLVGSIFSTVAFMPQSYAAHDNITIDINDEYDQGETIDITGSIDDVDEDVDEVTITVTSPDGNSDDDTLELDDDEFTFEYEIDNDDGIYTVEVEYDSDSLFSYFLVDEEDDDAEVDSDASLYEQEDTVEITGTVENPQLEADDVDITVEDPHGDTIEDETVDLDNDEFSFEFDLEDDAVPGRYAVKVVYDGDESGWLIFEVEEGSGGGSSSDDEISAQLGKSTYKPGEEVVITGSIDESDVSSSEDVSLEVIDSDGANIVSDDVEPANDGFFKFEFNLDDDAETGTYEVTIQYAGYPDKELAFTVSTSTSGGGSTGGGSGSGSSSGLTAKLSKTSLLAGETITVTGVVPRIVSDDPVNISVLRPDGTFVVAAFPEPESDKSYSATLRLPTSLEAKEDYSVVVYYDEKEVDVSFDVTGKTSGSAGGAITVKTDKATYSIGSTVEISGKISPDSFVSGQQIALQVFNPERAPYRFDPITPESDGSYSYSMAIGGPLGVSGEWDVKVTYGEQVAETNFDLTGGAPSTPKYELKVGDLTFPIEYQSDGTVKSMFVKAVDKQLVVSIDAEEDGTLTIVLPREVIDATQDGSDIKYVVATSDIDTGAGDSIDVTESSVNGEYRTLVIDYEAGTDLIEIQGTSVVPEFGPLSAIILAIAVFSIIAVTAKFSGRLGSFRQQQW